jgi:diguanylate cyclase
VVVTLSFLAGLTLQDSDPSSGKRKPAHALFSAVSAIALMFFPLQDISGVIVDLRAVPITLLTLHYGWWPGLAAATPVIVYRAFLGGQGAPVGIAVLLLTVLAAGYAARRVSVWEHPPLRLWWLAPAVFSSAIGALAVPGATSILPPILPHIIVANSVALGLAALVLWSRFRLLALVNENERLAHRDALTGLRNRRQFTRDVVSTGAGDHLLLIDLDDFKHINDHRGHDTGDEVLMAIGRVLRQQVRTRDRIYRLGGEEFAVLLRSCREADAAGAAERIRAAVPAAVSEALGEADLSVTISAGLVHLRPGDDAQRRLADADLLLYQAKRAGKNRVTIEESVASHQAREGLLGA